MKCLEFFKAYFNVINGSEILELRFRTLDSKFITWSIFIPGVSRWYISTRQPISWPENNVKLKGLSLFSKETKIHTLYSAMILFSYLFACFVGGGGCQYSNKNWTTSFVLASQTTVLHLGGDQKATFGSRFLLPVGHRNPTQVIGCDSFICWVILLAHFSLRHLYH